MPKDTRIIVTGHLPAGVTAARRGGGGSGSRVVVAENLQQVKREAHHGPVDGLVVVGATSPDALKELAAVVDMSKTVILAGPVTVPDACDSLHWLAGRQKGDKPSRSGVGGARDATLEDYVESRFGEFVRAMKASAARSLHATIIQAVEQPLIRHALRETAGNQLQAARLLGMNRNTLKKKMEAYRISAKRPPRSRPPRPSA